MNKKNIWSRNLKIRLFGETMFNVFYWMYFPFIAIYFSQSLGLAWAGVLMMVPPVLSLIAGLIGGSFADRFGRKRMMLCGVGIQFTMFILFATSSIIWLDYLAFLGITIGTGLYKPASDAMVADTVSAENRKEVFATFLTGSNLGAVIGPILGAWLFFDYRDLLLWSCAIVLMIYLLFIYFWLEETLFNTTNEGLFLPIKQLKDYIIILKDKKFSYYLLAGIFSVIAIMQLDLYLSVYIYDYVPNQTIVSFINYELSSKDILGYMLGLNGILFVLFVLPITKWLKGWSDKQVFILSCLLAGFGMFAVGFTTNIWMLLLLTILFTFGEIVRAPVLYNFVSEYAPENARGQYMAVSNMQFTIGRLLAPITVFLAAFFGPLIIFSFILLCALISLIFYIKLYK